MLGSPLKVHGVMRRTPKLFELNALSITLFYFIFASLWILLSDQFLIWITNDPILISQYQTVKGLLYVMCTAAFLYYLIAVSNNKISTEKNRVDEALYAANMATWSIDLKSKEIVRSEFHHKLFGFKKKPRAWSLKNFLDIIHPDDQDKVQKQLERTIDKESSGYEVRYRITWPDESVHWMMSRGNLVYDKNNKATHIAGVIADITEQKKLEEEYEHEKELFENVFQHIPIMVDITSDDFKAIRVNKAYEEITGWSQEEIQNRDTMHLAYPDEEERKRAEEAINEADGSWNEFTTYTKSGEERIQQWANIKLSDGSSIGIGLDVTEKRKLEKEHERDRQELQKVYDNIPVFISLYKGRREIHRINKYFEDVLGYTNDDLRSADLISELIPDRKNRVKAVKHLDEADGSWLDVRLMTKSGEIIDTTWTVISVTSSLKMGIGIDTTELKQKERELEEITDRYKNAEKIARFGHWRRNVKTDEAIWSEGFYNIIGLEPGERDTSYESMLEMIHPDDREEFDTAFKNALETGSLNVRYRLIKPSTGEVGYYHELAQTTYDEEGNPEFISGTIQDMTEIEEFEIELHQRNKFIETTLENLPIGVAVNLIDSGEATLMNSMFAEIYGWPKEVLTDVQTFFEKVYPDENYRSKMIEMITADIASEDPDRMQWNGIRIVTQDGEEKIVNAKNIPVYDQNLMISTVVDVTAQYKAEQKLAESEYNYRLLFQKSPLPMWIYNPDTLQFVEVNNAALQHYGYTRKEFQEMTILDIRPEYDREEVKQEVQASMKNKISDTKEWRHIKKNGEVIHVNVTGSGIDYFGNSYRLVLVNDITEQKKAEEMVLASLVEGENKERARIARELHDGLGQYLAAANMNLDSLKSDIEKLTERKQKQFQKGLTLLKHAVSETAQISRNLLPRVVDDYGLALAIEALVDNYSSDTEIEITYYQNINDLNLEHTIELNLYRIAQEAISNAVKYSEASQVNVQLIKDELDLILSIDDNGIGFDRSAEDFSPGLGLQTIKTRAGALGGEFELDTKPGKGTFIHIIVPIKNNIDS